MAGALTALRPSYVNCLQLADVRCFFLLGCGGAEAWGASGRYRKHK